jgi:hypothetical protein
MMNQLLPLTEQGVWLEALEAARKLAERKR